MQRDALIAIGGGLLSAVAAVSFFGGSVFSILFVYFASVPLLLVGLGLGPRAVTVAVGAGIVATALTGNMLHAGIFALVQAFPAWVITRLSILQIAGSGPASTPVVGPDTASSAMPAAAPPTAGGFVAWLSPGLTLSVLALCSGLFILFAALSVGDDGLKGAVDAYLGTAFELMMPAMEDQVKAQLVSKMSAFFPGAIAASWVIMVITNAAVAQGILVRAGKNLLPTPVYAAIDLPLWMSWPLVIAAATALAANMIGADELGYAAYNVTMVFAVPYFFLGLAVIHTLARRVTATGMVLVGVYGVIMVSLWTAVVVVAVGIAEQWIGLRDRQQDEDDGQSPDE
ncbi:MAG: DUF2232 domain-containing protein [Rhodospirillales bacterium]|nr:DUF2232 domain-containing protein [Rhodospirillales bacterium]